MLDLTSLSKNLWLWALKRDILFTAQRIYVPGVSNTVADFESRMGMDRPDWMVAYKMFQMIDQTFGPLEVDLFTTQLTHQLSCFYS